MTNTQTPSVSQAQAQDGDRDSVSPKMGEFHVDAQGYMTYRNTAVGVFGSPDTNTVRTTVFTSPGITGNDGRVSVSEVTYDFGVVTTIGVRVKTNTGKSASVELSIHGMSRKDLLVALMDAVVRVSDI